MKFKVLLLTSVVALSLFCCSMSDKQIDKKNHVLNNLMYQAFNQLHYSPVEMNDSVSAVFFDLYLERFDYGKRFLLSEDIQLLTKYKLLIDDEYKSGSLEFFNKSAAILDKRIKETEKYYTDILAKPFDFEIDEIFESDPEKRKFPESKEERKEVWRKILKLETLARVADKLETQKTAKENKDTSVTVKSFDELEKEAREKVQKRYSDWYHRMEQYDNSDRYATYINALAAVYDSHTEYFPPKDKEDFDIRMSGQLEGIGAVLSQRDEYITVIEVVPGSPSWKQGDLKAKDKILKVGQGEEPPVDIVDMRLDKAVQLVRGKKGTVVKLTVKKLDGSIKVIPITRDVVNIAETYAKSVIIENKDGSKVGFIHLPSFYLDMRHNGGRRCAPDVKKELLKLKKEKVDRIVLDLRNNGGGSLSDVVEMAGYFIEQGPIVQIKPRFRAPEVLRDRDPSVIFDGPLVVMVNSVSASASEIFAAAMQDYDRALIVGSPSTFGKGTVQRFFDLDRVLDPADADLKPIGQVKMTFQKFYRINGESTQLKGVIPDVVLPDYYQYIEVGEKETDSPLPWDEIPSSKYTKCTPGLPVAELKENSKKRIAADSTFMLVNESAKRLKTVRDETVRYLNYDKYTANRAKMKEESKKYENLGKDTLDMNIYSLKSDLEAMKGDTSKTLTREEWIKNLKKDYYLKETINIVNEMSAAKR